MNIKRIMSVLLVLVLISSIFYGCGSNGNNAGNSTVGEQSQESKEADQNSEETSDDKQNTTSEETIIEDIKKQGKLIVATEAGFPPMEYHDGDKIVGIDVDIVNEIAKELGVEVEFLELEFNSLVPALNSGKAHLIAAGMSYDEERAQKADYSNIYFKSMQVILAKADSGIETAEDLTGKKVGVQLNTTGDYYATDDVDCEVKQFNKYMQAVEELKNGTIDAIVVDNVPGKVFAEQNEDLVVTAELFEDQYGLVINKEQPKFMELINGVIDELIESGKIEEFQKKHIAVN